MHILVFVDRESNKLGMCVDFKNIVTVDIPESLRDDSVDTIFNKLNIGQDGTGAYSKSLPATIDEFMIFEGVFDADDVKALAEYYGIQNN
jgi:hypothetical protein